MLPAHKYDKRKMKIVFHFSIAVLGTCRAKFKNRPGRIPPTVNCRLLFLQKQLHIYWRMKWKAIQQQKQPLTIKRYWGPVTMMGKNQTLLMSSLQNSQHSRVSRLEVLNIRIYSSRFWTFRSEVQKSRFSLSSLWAVELCGFQNQVSNWAILF